MRKAEAQLQHWIESTGFETPEEAWENVNRNRGRLLEEIDALKAKLKDLLERKASDDADFEEQVKESRRLGEQVRELASKLKDAEQARALSLEAYKERDQWARQLEDDWSKAEAKLKDAEAAAKQAFDSYQDLGRCMTDESYAEKAAREAGAREERERLRELPDKMWEDFLHETGGSESASQHGTMPWAVDWLRRQVR